MRSITTPAQAVKLVGRKIVAVALSPFADGRGGKAFDPEIILDDGSCLRFTVQETEVGVYGVRIDRLFLDAKGSR